MGEEATLVIEGAEKRDGDSCPWPFCKGGGLRFFVGSKEGDSRSCSYLRGFFFLSQERGKGNVAGVVVRREGKDEQKFLFPLIERGRLRRRLSPAVEGRGDGDVQPEGF